MSDAEVVYSCDICRKVVASKPILRLHYKRVHKFGNGQLKKTTFSSLPDATRSKMPTVGGGNLKVKMANTCDQCGDTFASTASLVQHFSSCSGRSKSGEGDRAQPTSRGETVKARRAGRVVDGDNSNAITCPECFETFSRKFTLERHLRKQHKVKGVKDISNEAPKDPTSQCPHCKKVTLSGNLQRHIKEYCPVVKASKTPQPNGSPVVFDVEPKEFHRSPRADPSSKEHDGQPAGKKPRTNPLSQQASNTREEQPAIFSHSAATISGAVAADFPITPETMDSDFEIKKEIKMEIKEEPSDE